MISPSTTGCHGIMLGTTSTPQRSGSGSHPDRPSTRLGPAAGDRLDLQRSPPASPQRRASRRTRPTRRAVVGRHHLMRSAALGDGSPKQPLGTAWKATCRCLRLRRLAEDGDVVGIAAEGGDVVSHPVQGRDLVEQAEVGVPSPRERRPSAPTR